MTLGLLGITNWPAAIVWLLIAAAVVAGWRIAREDQRHRREALERGRRDYPCSHGASEAPRWPAAPRRRSTRL